MRITMLLLLAVVACRGDERLKASRIETTSTLAAHVAVATTHTITFRVVANNGRSVPGVKVDINTAGVSGTVMPLTAVTDKQGDVRVTWTAGTTPRPITLRAAA